MKKIFAIALALVMVLSMASAFASPCMGGFDWTCATAATNCGKGKVEVVPYVKVNNGCGGFDWQASECASAVSSENVFYTVKLTVDANADKEWWAQAKVELSYKGMAKSVKLPSPNLASVTGLPAVIDASTDVKASEANTFYYDFTAKAWDLVTDTFEFGAANINTVKVGDSSKTKVCATLKSAVDYDKGMAGRVGNYYVAYTESPTAAEATAATIVAPYAGQNFTKLAVWVDGVDQGWTIEIVDGKIVATAPATGAIKTATFKKLLLVEAGVGIVGGAEATNGTAEVLYDDNYIVVMDKDAKEWLVTYVVRDGKIVVIDFNDDACGYDTYATIKAYFGLEIGTCITEKLIKANFGWEDKFEHCYAWKNSAPSIVDAECVVAIPKTGDKGLLWWLF